jgi:hypothetical protein
MKKEEKPFRWWWVWYWIIFLALGIFVLYKISLGLVYSYFIIYIVILSIGVPLFLLLNLITNIKYHIGKKTKAIDDWKFWVWFFLTVVYTLLMFYVISSLVYVQFSV